MKKAAEVLLPDYSHYPRWRRLAAQVLQFTPILSSQESFSHFSTIHLSTQTEKPAKIVSGGLGVTASLSRNFQANLLLC